MSERIKNGGPAFPRPLSETEGTYDPGTPGMTLRDWMAGQALVSMGTWFPSGIDAHNNLSVPASIRARAKWAYAQADAMLKARGADDADG